MASNVWCRLWHDMPTDPKFRVIAKASGQPLHLVISLYVCIMVDASRNEKSRGVTTCHDENFAVTLDCDMSQIEAIKEAMQGRVLDGNKLTGWHKRQVKKEDSGNPETGAKSAAERQADKRARDRQAALNDDVTECHGESRNVTLDKDKEKSIKTYCVTPGGETPKPENKSAESKKTGSRLPDNWVLPKAWGEWALAERPDFNADDIRLEAETFADYWHAEVGAKARKSDWQATWRNWVRRANGLQKRPDRAQKNAFAGALR